jgi:hypothetical protein
MAPPCELLLLLLLLDPLLAELESPDVSSIGSGADACLGSFTGPHARTKKAVETTDRTARPRFMGLDGNTRPDPSPDRPRGVRTGALANRRRRW